jgi:hypothetical protein
MADPPDLALAYRQLENITQALIEADARVAELEDALKRIVACRDYDVETGFAAAEVLRTIARASLAADRAV